ncbi:MAG: ATP-binding protein [Muribaculaceae bacterium]|nr:ATP-binding protein [Muribaculaceae bacterium]
MEHPRNPFILGHRIERPYFCDREEEEKRLASAVTNGRNVVLLSPRRMGKTSLINVTVHNSPIIQEKYQTFFLDILQSNTLSEFTYLLGRTVFSTLAERSRKSLKGFLAALKSLKGTFGFDPLSGTPTFNIQLGDIQHPEYTLEEIFTYLEQNDRPVMLIIDEFQQITKYPEKNTEAILRGYMQRLSNATFIFAGSEFSILQEMFVSSKRPFYNSSELMHLGAISEDVYIAFATELFEQRGRQLEEAGIRRAYALFEGNTFYLQRTMNGAFADTSEGKTCDEEVVIRSIRSMLAANEVIYREMLSKISISQKSLLIAVAKEKRVTSPTSGNFIKRHSLASASSVQSALRNLIKGGIITKDFDGYTLTDSLFRIFINHLYSEPEL